MFRALGWDTININERQAVRPEDDFDRVRNLERELEKTGAQTDQYRYCRLVNEISSASVNE
jgi:hypothetical protein